MAPSQCQVIVVADPPTLEMAQVLMREGARGLLAAPVEGPTLRDAISGLCEAGLRGDSASAPLPVFDPEEVFAARHGLTARQTEVLNHLLQGQANKEVAAALSISLRTLEDHISRLLRKTRTKDVRLLLALHRSDTSRMLAAPGIPRVGHHDIACRAVEGSSSASETQDASAEHRSVRLQCRWRRNGVTVGGAELRAAGVAGREGAGRPAAVAARNSAMAPGSG